MKVVCFIIFANLEITSDYFAQPSSAALMENIINTIFAIYISAYSVIFVLQMSVVRFLMYYYLYHGNSTRNQKQDYKCSRTVTYNHLQIACGLG